MFSKLPPPRTLVVSALTLIFPCLLHGQTDLIKGSPLSNHGYLILDETAAPSVEFYQVSIISKTYSPSDPLGYTESILKKYEIWDSNFLKIDKAFWDLEQNNSYNIVHVEAYDSNGEMISEEDEVLEYGMGDDRHLEGGPTHFRADYWDCVSSNYAYRIQQWRSVELPSIGYYSLLPVQQYQDDGTEIPYYQYFDEVGVNIYTNFLQYYPPGGGYAVDSDGNLELDQNGNPVVEGPIQMNPAFHGLQGQWNDAYLQSMETDQDDDYVRTFFSFNQYETDGSVNYIDQSGVNLILPTIYALQKYTGWWRQYPLRMPDEGDMQVDGVSGNDLSWAVDLFNDSSSTLYHNQGLAGSYMQIPYHPESYPDLDCAAGFGSITITDGPGVAFWDCVYDYNHGQYWELIFSWEDGTWQPDNVWDWLEIFEDCYNSSTNDDNDGSGSDSNGGGGVLTDAEMVYIQTLGQRNDTLVGHWSHDDLFTSDGTFVTPSIGNLNPGLYQLGIKLPATDMAYITIETREPLSTSVPLKDLVSATIFPVPIQDDHEFNINFDVAANSNFVYQLFDNVGNLLHEQEYVLKAGHNENHVVRTDDIIPDGILINKFSFRDGSYFTITTTK